MKYKKVLILILLLLLTGCSTEYKLEISNNKFKENINAIIPKNMIQTTNEQENIEIEYDDPITPFLEQKTSSLTSNDKFYKKKVTEKGDYFEVKMDYSYDEETFKNANSINTCFEFPELDFSESYYINLQGTFYCLYGDSIDIKINTKNKVKFNNADEVSGNTYIWHINEKNSDYVDIKIEVEKGTSTSLITGIVLAVFIVTIIGIILYKFYSKNKQRNNI